MYFILLTLTVILGISFVSPERFHSNGHSLKLLDRIPRIQHGNATTIEKFPYTVSIETNVGNSTFFCGGSIISSNIILTAAHCVDGVRVPGSFQIRAGSSYREHGGSVHNVSKFSIHPRYNESDSTPRYDVATLLLQNPIELDNVTTRSIEMFQPGQKIQDSSVAILTGWGRLSYQGSSPGQLQILKMKYIGKDNCSEIRHRYFRDNYGLALGELNEGEICTTTFNNDELESFCNGDSGGPMVVGDKLAGVMSRTKIECTSKPLPNVFSEVAFFRKWIDEKLNEYKVEGESSKNSNDVKPVSSLPKKN